MTCRRCGAPAYTGQTTCFHCGAPLQREQSSPELAHPASGVPAEPFEASTYGPPVAVDVVPGALEDSRPVRRTIGYRPVTLSPQPRSATSLGRGCVRVALLALLVVVGVITLILLWSRLPVSHAGSALPAQLALAGVAFPTSHAYWMLRKEQVRSPGGFARDLTNG